ncbi:MAG TPA: ferritin-like domain-containing protein [Acidimicrobiales bacterium]|nr:ferritin-like domain-containing protein [Acidimicrobiales bacterium]
MNLRRQNDHVSDAELSAMTDHLDQVHRDQALPAMQAAVAEWADSLRQGESDIPRRANRRTFLLGAAGAGAGGLLLAACSSSSKSSSSATTVPGSPTSSSSGLTGDLAVAAMAASLENLGVFAYSAGLQAAQAGKLGAVPPAVATFAQTAMAQHKDHAKAWNSVLTAAGKPAVTATDPALTPTVQQKFGQVKDVTGLAELALLIENVAAQTYQNGIAVLSSSQAVAVAATIQPVEMQHAATLYYALGRYPGIQGEQSSSYSMGTPLAFNPISLARPPADYQGS